jgi:hypothetical protein
MTIDGEMYLLLIALCIAPCCINHDMFLNPLDKENLIMKNVTVQIHCEDKGCDRNSSQAKL